MKCLKEFGVKLESIVLGFWISYASINPWENNLPL